MAKSSGKRFCFVYRTTNLRNGKYYIGCHCTFKLDDGYLGSGMRIQRAVAKHGRESFKLEILQFFESREEALAREKELVTEELLKDPMCMNMKLGGEGGWTDRARKKGSAKLVAKIWSDAAFKQRQTERTANRNRQLHASGKLKAPDWTGRKHTERAKENMRKSSVGKHDGSKNSQFGTCWINKNGETIKIKKTDLKDWLDREWKLGRKNGV